MELKITVPEHIGDITLEEFQKYEVLNQKYTDKEYTAIEYNKRKIELFSGIPYHRIDHANHKQLEELLKDIDKALGEDAPFKDRFFIQDEEFGFIPNFDKITAGEFFDLNNYGSEVDQGKGIPVETMHKLMAVLFRPIKKSHKNAYSIIDYDGTEKYAEVMKHMKMNVVNGALVFFCNLSRELLIRIQRYTQEVRVKAEMQVITSLNGDGTVPSTN